MRLRRAVPKIPARPSVPPRLPLHKSYPCPTRSESTLPQLLIPLHSNSFISNAYRKPQGEGPTSRPKVWHLVTRKAARVRTDKNSRNPNPLCGLLHNFCTPPGGGPDHRGNDAVPPLPRPGCRVGLHKLVGLSRLRLPLTEEPFHQLRFRKRPLPHVVVHARVFGRKRMSACLSPGRDAIARKRD